MQNLKLYTQEEIVNMLFDTTAEMGKQICDAKRNMDYETFYKIFMTVVRFKSSMLEKLGFSEEEIDELVNKYKEMKNESNT